MKLVIVFTIFTLCSAQCPGGFNRMDSNANKCYKYVHAIGVLAETAFQVCKNLGADVISIQSVAENNELVGAINNCNNDTQNCGSAWIGLLWQNNSNTYSWSDGESLTYTNFDHSTNYCNDGFFGEHFFVSWNKMWYNCPFSSYNGKIHGVLCEHLLVKPPTQTPRIPTTTKKTTTTTKRTTTTSTYKPTTTTPAYKPPTTQAQVGDCPAGWYQSIVNPRNCFLFISDAKDWNKANFQCFAVDRRASLATIESIFAGTELVSTAAKSAPQCYDFFIGLHQDNQYSSWVWINGENSDYRNWRTSYPIYSDTNTNCAVLNLYDSKWTNALCSLISKCYICQIIL